MVHNSINYKLDNSILSLQNSNQPGVNTTVASTESTEAAFWGSYSSSKPTDSEDDYRWVNKRAALDLSPCIFFLFFDQ